MMKITLKPHYGVEIDNKMLLLGDDKENIINLFGEPDFNLEYKISFYNLYSYHYSILFNKDFKAEFIEFSYNNIDNIIYFHDINIFEENADELIKKIGKYDIVTIANNQTIFDLKNIDLALWRVCIPEDIEEDLGENDYEKGIKFSTVGIGAKGYLND